MKMSWSYLIIARILTTIFSIESDISGIRCHSVTVFFVCASPSPTLSHSVSIVLSLCVCASNPTTSQSHGQQAQTSSRAAAAAETIWEMGR